MEKKRGSTVAARKKNRTISAVEIRRRRGIIFAAGFLVVLAGCQETPKESIVKQKGADKIKEYESNEETQSSEKPDNNKENQKNEESENGKAGDTLDEEEPAEEKEGKINETIKAPKTYKNQAEYEGGKLVVDTDAEIILPKVDSMNTYKVSAREADQELIDQVSKIFFEGAKFYSGYDYNEWTKEDYQKDLTMLKKCLEAENFLVYTADNAKKALELMSVAPDIILLDINMPEMDGLELCQFVREHISCPIIFLTARVSEQDVIQGLSVGGDDYITKPFRIDELLARILAHLRREERKNNTDNLKFDNELVIDYNSRMVFLGERQLDFSNKEFEIIRLLSQNAGMVFDRETIYEKLWGYDGEGDSIVVKEHIRKIRNKLANYTEKNYIETVWGVGYRWIK